MSGRRKKLTAADRAKKSAKRERRAEEAPARDAERKARRKARLERSSRLLRAQQGYLLAVRDAPTASEVVCERCLTAQRYHHGDGVSKCAGPLGLGCGHDTCVTVEAFSEAA